VQTVRFSGGAQPCDGVDEAVESSDTAVVQWRRRWTSCRWQRPSWSVRVRTVGWRQWQWTSYSVPCPSTSYLWRCATGAHQPFMGWAPPIRAQVKGPVGHWASWWRSIPTFSPLISSYTFNFRLYFTLISFTIPSDQRIEHASSSRLVADRFNSYNTHLWSETNSLTLSPLLSGNHRLYHKSISTMCSLNTLGDKPLVSGSASTFLLLICSIPFSMIPDFLLYNV
jgi:hypothetical protein